MDYDTWLQSDKAFEEFHGLDEFAEQEEKESAEEEADREYEKYKDKSLWRE